MQPKFAALALATALALTPAWSQTVTDSAFASAMVEFSRAAGGESGAIESAILALKALTVAAPTDPVLRAYSGAAKAMRAKTTLLPWRKIGHVEEGLAQIDKALAQLTPAHDAPEHRGVSASLETRFVAANTFLALPGLFNRGPRGAQLLDEVLRNPLLDSSPASFRGSVWMLAAGEAVKAKRPDDARRWLDKVVETSAPQAAAAQARLKEL